jgi:hypothetical protein
MPGEQVCQGCLDYNLILNPYSLRYIIREYDFNEEEIEKQREELQMADLSEKELWVSIQWHAPAPMV